MKTVKSTGKMNKPSFFDRVRNHSQKDLQFKQKFDINHIRQSNYKLQRTKSFRNDHSLQRKAPIIAQQLQYSKSRQHLHKATLQTEISEDFKENNKRVRFQDCCKHNKENQWQSNNRDSELNGCTSEMFINKKKQRNNMHFNEILSLLKTGLSKNEKKEVPQTSQDRENGYLDLQQEQQCLNLIKMVWEGVALMKQRPVLREQALKMENLLKHQVIKLAKPKLQILQEASALSLKIFPFGTTPFEKGASIKDEKQLSVQNFNLKSQEQDGQCSQQIPQSHNCISRTSEQESKQELEYKKIMYILEQSKKNKITDMIEQSRSQDETEKDYIISHEQSQQKSQVMRNKQRTHHLSSFNSVVTASDKQTIYCQEKVNKSCSNDKLFLKNIVKKAKKVDAQLQQTNKQNQVNNPKRINSDNRNMRIITSIESEACGSIVQEQDQLTDSFKEESNTTSLENSHTGMSFSKYPGSSKVMSEAQSSKSEGESKRATLNNIVNMLNQRYNKKIKLQPPK